MKTNLRWLTLLAGMTLTVPMHAADNNGGRGWTARSSAPARPSGGFVRSVPRGNFSAARPIMQGQRFSSVGVRSAPAGFQRSFVSQNPGAVSITPRFSPRSVDRSDRARFADPQNRAATFRASGVGAQRQLASVTRSYVNPNSNASLAQRFAARNVNRGDLTRSVNQQAGSARLNNNRLASVRSSNRGLNRAAAAHVFARRSAGWHRDWDRNREHWWHGHCCRFINGTWVIFDLGFYPWWPYGYPYYDYSYYGYSPYDYYPSGYYSPDYYSYQYDPGTYDQGNGQYDDNGYNSSDQSSEPSVADVQKELAKEGYYSGEIDGVLGPETRRAIVNFQSDHGLRITGNLNSETLSTLGL